MQTAFGVLALLVFSVSAWGANFKNFSTPLYDLNFRLESPVKLTSAQIRSWIDNPKLKIKTVNDLLKFMAKKPELSHFFSNVVLQHSSQSLFKEAVSEKYPRVIFHDQGLFFAVTGDPAHQEAYESLELAEYDPAIGDYQYHLWNQKKWDVNPDRCTHCHGEKPRPLWRHYPVWPGSFAGNSQHLSAKEAELLKDLVEHQQKEGYERYSKFYLETPTIERSNIELGMHISRTNWKRIANRMEKAGVLYEQAPLILAAFGCEELPGYLPSGLREIREAQLGMDFKTLLEDTERHIEAEEDEKIAEFSLTAKGDIASPEPFDLANAGTIAGLRYLFEEIDGLDVPSWSVSYSPGSYSYSFTTGAYGIHDFYRLELRERYLKHFPKRMARFDSFDDDEDRCKYLKRWVNKKLGATEKSL